MAATRSSIPAHIPSERVIDYDYLRDPRLPHEPYLTLKELQQHPYEMMWTTANGGHWIATRRQTIINIMQRPDLFSSAHINIPPMEYREVKLIPEELDPPEHGKYRNILNPLFAPKAIAQLERDVRKLTRDLLDAVYPEGKADIMSRLTMPLPVSVFLRLFGLPPERKHDFLQWKDGFLFADDEQRKKGAIANIAREIKELVAQRRVAPRDDMATALVQARVEGRPLNEQELLSMGFLLFLAGLDTVTNALSSCFAYLALNPSLRQRLIENPDLIRDAIEEIIRRYSVVNNVRTATQDVTWEGVQIRKNEQVLISTIVANLDDRVIDNPVEVRIDRGSDPHLGFGAGPHRCVGSHLARLEIRIALEEALPRLKNMRLPAGHRLHYHSANLVGLSELPLEWDVD